MSVIFHSGFDGVSTQTSRVLGRIAARTAARSVMSTNVVSSFQRAKVSRRSREGRWYASIGATTWSPGSSARRIADVAADAEADAAAAHAASSEARHSSNYSRMGLLWRA